jgi:hypothetical protein
VRERRERVEDSAPGKTKITAVARGSRRVIFNASSPKLATFLKLHMSIRLRSASRGLEAFKATCLFGLPAFIDQKLTGSPNKQSLSD